jgi:peptide/nickel transport system substrate-binding protein
MQRRHLLKLAAGAAMLSAPHIARAQRPRTLRYVPGIGLTLLDPLWTPARGTHIHAYLVFDTLYGLDQTLTARPQMLEGHTVENNGLVWTQKLREGLWFHDGTPVLARDAIASIQRFGVRDPFGSALLAATDELSAPDDGTLRFRLNKPFPHLPEALAGSTSTTPCIMPERLARTDPYRQVPEMVGSGPFRFSAAEFNAGERSVYERFEKYTPRGEGTPSYSSGPKVTHFDRVEWQTLGDGATAIAALMQGEVDWLDSVSIDQVPLLSHNDQVKVEITEPTGSIPIMRFNHLHPPFNNPAIRRALLGAVDQADVMNALTGDNRALWHDRVGLFVPTSRLANEANIEVLSGPRDYGKVRRDLAEAGYRGEPIVVLTVADSPVFTAIGAMGVEQLRKAGMNVDQRTTDFSTMFRRMNSKEPPDRGGWNIYFTPTDGLFSDNPAANNYIRGDGKSGAAGWANSPRLESLRAAWLDAEDTAAEKQIGEQMQRQMWQDVPYIPMGHWVRSTAKGVTEFGRKP